MKIDKEKPSRVKMLIWILIVIGIINLLCVSRCTRVYSKYSENYRDTIYIEKRTTLHCINGDVSGIVQSFKNTSGKYIIDVRDFSDGSLKSVKVGNYDFYNIQKGDTIIGKGYRQPKQKSNKHNKHSYKGFIDGVVVDKKADSIYIRDFEDSQLHAYMVGKFDYDTINLGDTIYNK